MGKTRSCALREPGDREKRGIKVRWYWNASSSRYISASAKTCTSNEEARYPSGLGPLCERRDEGCRHRVVGDRERERDRDLELDSERSVYRSTPAENIVAFTYACWNCAARSMKLEIERLTRCTSCAVGLGGVSLSDWPDRFPSLVRGRPRPIARGSLHLGRGGGGRASGCSDAATAGALGGGLEDRLRVAMEDSDGGDVDKGEEKTLIGLLVERGDDEGVVRAVVVERKELLVENENQEPERVTVEVDDELVDADDDALEIDSAVEARRALTATDFFTLVTGSDIVSLRPLTLSPTWAGPRSTASSSALCWSRRVYGLVSSSSSNNGPCMAARTSEKETERERLLACLRASSRWALGRVRESLSEGDRPVGGESDIGREGGDGMMSYRNMPLSSDCFSARVGLGNRASAFRRES